MKHADKEQDIRGAPGNSDANLRALLNATTDVAFLTDAPGTILAANESTVRVYNTPPDKLIGTSIHDHVGPDLYLISKKKAAEAAESGEPVRFEATLKGKVLDHRIYPIFDERAHVTKLAIYIRDITEQKRTEEMCRVTEESYRKIYENATEGIFQVTLDGRFLSANPSLARIHGYDSPEELMRVTDISRQLYVDPGMREELIEALEKRGSVQGFEIQTRRKDGSLQWISLNARVVRDSQGNFLYHEGTMQDITERKAAQAALAESEERYRTAIEHSNDGVAILQKDRYQYVNRRFVEMFGYERTEELVGKQISATVHPDDRDRVININTRRWSGLPAPERYEFRGITRDGKTIYVEVSATKTVYRNRPVTLVYLRDITERKRAEEAFLQSHMELEQLNRAKSKAVDHISHELKTPLAVIQGNVRILKRKLQSIGSDDGFRGITEVLERNLERLFGIQKETQQIFRTSQELEAATFQDELDRLWTRMEGFSAIPADTQAHWHALKAWIGKHMTGDTASLTPVDLYPFALQVLDQVRGRARHREIRFELEGEAGLRVFMDPAILGEVVEGLLKNAIENTPDAGLIRVAVGEKDNRIWLHVADFGVGITKENQQYIFDGLFHTEETTLYASKSPYDFGAGGKGLDLLRMKLHAKRFGFDLSVKSARCIYLSTDQDLCPGNIRACPHCRVFEECIESGGTTFSVSFPAEPARKET